MTQLSKTERFLRVFTEVKPGEGATAVMMFANVFLILLAYYFIKPLREGWIAISDIEGLTKMEVKAYSSFAQSLILLFIVGWYARLADRWDRVTLFTRATLFCISNMVIFWFLQPNFFFEQLPLSGIVYYLWVGMFGVFVVAQFWTFCADVYTDERGKRMLPFIAIGATSGAAAGVMDGGQTGKFGSSTDRVTAAGGDGYRCLFPFCWCVLSSNAKDTAASLVQKHADRDPAPAMPCRRRPASGVAQNLCWSASSCCWRLW